MEHKKEDFPDIPARVKEKAEAMESMGNLILGGIGVFAYEHHTIQPVYLSSGAGAIFYNMKPFFPDGEKIPLHKFMKEKYYERLCRKVEECIENHTILDDTIPFSVSPKSERWIWIRGCEEEEEEGRRYFVTLLQDVTKQKQLENELALQNERYRLLEETSSEILFELDLVKDVMNYSFKEMDGSLIRQRIPHYHDALQINPMVHADYIGTFQHHLSLASAKKAEGQMEYLSKISGNGYEWHHMVYRSLENGDGMINRIVGRIKNIHDEVLNRQQIEEPLSNLMKSSFSAIQVRIARLLENADLEDRHAMVLLSVNHYKKIIEQNGVACGDVVVHHMLDKLQEKVGDCAIYGHTEEGKVLIYMKNIEEQELDETMQTVIGNIQNTDFCIPNLHPVCSAGAAVMCGAVDFLSFYHEVEEALHIAKLTKGERYIRV